jgi:[1-hydroxy-2-(trimethylamino)ethyl]phosphonate dioxygenase
MKVVDFILQLFTDKGDAAYFGEPVSQTAHGLQTAHLATQAGADDSLIVAALIHDVGHLLHGLPETVADQGVDGRHEDQGAVWLARYFGEEVTEPIRLHVAAKRYLCAVDSEYLSKLSPASIQSLQLQGGPFKPGEVRVFESSLHYKQAVQLRHWDDRAKEAGLDVPALESYRARLAKVVKREEM